MNITRALPFGKGERRRRRRREDTDFHHSSRLFISFRLTVWILGSRGWFIFVGFWLIGLDWTARPCLQSGSPRAERNRISEFVIGAAFGRVRVGY